MNYSVFCKLPEDEQETVGKKRREKCDWQVFGTAGRRQVAAQDKSLMETSGHWPMLHVK